MEIQIQIMENYTILSTSELKSLNGFIYKSKNICFDDCYPQTLHLVSSMTMPFFLVFKDYESAHHFMSTNRANHTLNYWKKCRRKMFPLGNHEVLIKLLYSERLHKL